MSKFNILGSVNPALPNEPKTIDISLIDADEHNFYAADREKEEKRTQLLAEEIMEVGFRSVIEVRPVGSRYCVIAGETRLAAMKLAYEQTKNPQFQFIPCYVQEDDDIQNRRRLIIDNLLQRELTPGLKMQAIEELQKAYRDEKEAGKKLPGRIAYLIANDIHLSKSQVGTYQTVINKGSDAVKEALKNETISLDTAAKISSLPKEEQDELVQEEDLNKDKVNSYLKERKAPKAPMEEIQEMSIYDYLDEDDEMEECDEYVEAVELSDSDKKLLHEVLDNLNYYITELECDKTRISAMENKDIADQVREGISELIEAIEEINEIIQ